MEMKTFQEFIAEAYIKKSDVSGYVKAKYGAVPAKATDASIKGAVDKAIANPGQPQSASLEKGKRNFGGEFGINVAGTVSTGPKPKPIKLKPEPEPESETRKPREVTRQGTREVTRQGTRTVAPAGSGTRQKPTQIIVRGDGKGTRRTSLRDLSGPDLKRVLNNLKPMPSTAGKYAGWRPTAVILNKSSTGTRTDKVYQAPRGYTQQARQQSSTGSGPRRVSQQPSSLGSRTRSVF